jgi:hypothetical protein
MTIASDRLLEVEGTKRGELWSKLQAGWSGCGWSTLFRNPATGTVIGLPDHCDRLLCPYCELRRVAKVRDRYRSRHDAALAERRIYIATLTIPNVPLGELKAALDRLRSAIAKLRRRTLWTEEVLGGIWRLEVTVNLKTRTWHPHANLLFETRRPIRMADWQPQIQAEWQSVLGEVNQQWIWLLPGWDGTLAETVKRQVVASRGGADVDWERDAGSTINYTVKPDPHWIVPSDPAWVVEYVEALSGARSVSSFGAWRHKAAEDAAEERVDEREELVPAPTAPGDAPFVDRSLPLLDPLTDTEADWQFHGRGPRWALRKHRPRGEGRREWLVWNKHDGTADPALVDDDAPLQYQARLALDPSW